MKSLNYIASITALGILCFADTILEHRKRRNDHLPSSQK